MSDSNVGKFYWRGARDYYKGLKRIETTMPYGPYLAESYASKLWQLGYREAQHMHEAGARNPFED